MWYNNSDEWEEIFVMIHFVIYVVQVLQTIVDPKMLWKFLNKHKMLLVSCSLLELLKETYSETSEYGYELKKLWKMNVYVFQHGTIL